MKGLFFKKEKTPVCIFHLAIEMMRPISLHLNSEFYPIFTLGIYPFKTYEALEVIKNPDFLELLLEFAVNEHPTATYFLGMLYKDRVLKDPTESKAQKLLSLSASKGYIPADYELAKDLVFYGTETTVKQGIDILEKYASSPYLHPASLYTLGLIYIEGINVSPDFEKGLFYLKEAAVNQHYLPAYLSLSKILMDPQSKLCNMPEGIKWLKEGIAKGCPNCKGTLAIHYLNGVFNDGEWLVDVDEAEAAKLLEEAALSGDIYQILNYARFLSVDHYPDFPAEPDKALMWFKKAAESGNLDGQFCLANLSLEIKTQPKS